MKIDMKEAIAIARSAWAGAVAQSAVSPDSQGPFFQVDASARDHWLVRVLQAPPCSLPATEVFPDHDSRQTREIGLIRIDREITDLPQYKPEVTILSENEAS